MSGGVSYTRNEGRPQVGRDSSIPRFHVEAVKDELASAAAGHPIFVSQERVQIIQPNNPSSPVMLVNDEHREKWPDHYRAFKEGNENFVDGTPLEHWAYLPRAQVLTLKAAGLHSVEQCAALSDLGVQKLGLGGSKIRDAAKAWLDDAAQMSITTAAIDRAERSEAETAHYKKQIDELRPLMDNMHKELMQLKNQASAVDRYVPGDHDPYQQALQARPAAPVATAGLDSLPALTPRRGRPPRAQEEAAA